MKRVGTILIVLPGAFLLAAAALSIFGMRRREGFSDADLRLGGWR